MSVPKKILVIDDSEGIRKLIKHYMTRQGYEVLLAENGRQGVVMARKNEPDLIIVDVQMPEMDGYEATRLIRQVHATMHTPIIMLTGLSTLENMQAGFDAGVDDYMTKPFKPNELQLRVEAVLRRVERVHQSKQEFETSTIGVFSLRGGSGSTSIATNLAVGLVQLWSHPTALIDLSMPVGTADLLLNMSPRQSLSSLLDYDANTADAEVVGSALADHPSGLRLLAGLRSPIDAELLSENLVSVILDTINSENKYTVIDLPHTFHPSTLAVLDRVDHLIMPITPDIVSMRLAVASMRVLESIGVEDENIHVVINSTMSNGSISVEQITKLLGREPLVSIPYVENLWNVAINMGKPVIMGNSSHPLVQLLEDMCWRFSTVTDRSRKFDNPNPMWRRIAERRKKAKTKT